MKDMKSKFASVEFKNSSIGLISQAVSIILLFLSRSVFINTLGIELLGINGTFASIVNALSLAELGFQSAIVYCLYTPLNEKDYKQVNDIINIIKRVYEGVAVFIFAASFAILPFLKFVLKDVEITNSIYVFFILQSLATSVSYILGYRRTLLYADQREYVSKIVDIICNLVFTICKIAVLLLLNNYYIYLILQIGQVMSSNAIIYFISSRKYAYLRKSEINKSLFSKIIKYVKDVFVARIAGYVYSSTDNIIVSTFIGATAVGILGNYGLVASNLKTLSSAILNPLTPIIGNMLAVENRKQNKKKLFENYTKIRFIIAIVLVVPMIVLMQDFITYYAGDKYLLTNKIVWLFAIDLYIHIVHSVTCDFINGEGLFRQERNIEITGAVMNIVSSIVLAHYIGLEGVLLGTVVSQVFFWISRSWLVYKNILSTHKKEYFIYWIKNIGYVIYALICCIICLKIYRIIPDMNILLKMVLGGIIIEFFCIVCAIIIIVNK